MVSTASVAQLNVRINQDAKVAGEDAAAFNRLLRDVPASHGETRGSSPQRAQRLDTLARMRTLRDQWMLSVGLDDSSLLRGEVVVGEDERHPDREHAFEALIERTKERDIR